MAALPERMAQDPKVAADSLGMSALGTGTHPDLPKYIRTRSWVSHTRSHEDSQGTRTEMLPEVQDPYEYGALGILNYPHAPCTRTSTQLKP